jgi:hypothetical protein
MGPVTHTPAVEAPDRLQRMSWLLALPLLLVAAVVALLPVALLLRRPVSLPYLVAETFVTALALIAAVWLGIRPRSGR